MNSVDLEHTCTPIIRCDEPTKHEVMICYQEFGEYKNYFKKELIWTYLCVYTNTNRIKY